MRRYLRHNIREKPSQLYEHWFSHQTSFTDPHGAHLSHTSFAFFFVKIYDLCLLDFINRAPYKAPLHMVREKAQHPRLKDSREQAHLQSLSLGGTFNTCQPQHYHQKNIQRFIFGLVIIRDNLFGVWIKLVQHKQTRGSNYMTNIINY